MVLTFESLEKNVDLKTIILYIRHDKYHIEKCDRQLIDYNADDRYESAIDKNIKTPLDKLGKGKYLFKRCTEEIDDDDKLKFINMLKFIFNYIEDNRISPTDLNTLIHAKVNNIRNAESICS